MSRPKPSREAALLRALSRCKRVGACLIWPGAISGFGYPVAHLCGRGTYTYLHVEVHRQYIGPVPDGWKVDHKCEVKRCLNETHLEAVPHQENIRRAFA